LRADRSVPVHIRVAQCSGQDQRCHAHGRQWIEQRRRVRIRGMRTLLCGRNLLALLVAVTIVISGNAATCPMDADASECFGSLLEPVNDERHSENDSASIRAANDLKSVVAGGGRSVRIERFARLADAAHGSQQILLI
jgi:hypothetical protein